MKSYRYPELQETLYRDTLPNGLTLVVLPRSGFSRKLAYFVTGRGAIHRKFRLDGREITAPAGVAHFLEHKLFDMPERDITKEFAALGANPNAFTSYDMTAYYFSCTDNFPQCLSLLLEFVSTPYFTRESVEKEQGIIGQEIAMNQDNPETRVFENLMQGMYNKHPIQEAILGTAESIGEITPEILETCYRAYYAMKNMMLCVIGDVNPEEIRQLALKVLPSAEPNAGEKLPMPQEEMTCPKALTEVSMEVAMPMFQLGFKSRAIGTGRNAIFKEIVGDLAAEALFGESSELYLQLYEQGLIDSSFGGGFETIEGMSMLTAFGDSRQPKAVADAILKQAEKILQQGLNQQDFLRMKRSALGRRIRDLDSFDATCFRLCAYHFTGFDYFQFPEVYRQVTVSDVLDFLRETVTKERRSLSVVYPLKQEVAQ